MKTQEKEAVDKALDMTPDGLAGQLRDVILDHVQKMRTTWDQLPAAEQKAYIDNASKDAVTIIDGCLDCILIEGGITLDATCHDVKIKKESIQAAISIDRSAEHAGLLQKAAHKPVKLAFAPQRDQVRDLGETPKPDDDQREMFKSDEEVMRGDAAPKKTKPRRLKLAAT